MKGDYKFLLVIGVLVFSIISFVYAGHIVIFIGGDTATNYSIVEDTVNLFNVTINNTDAGGAANITIVNITFSSSSCVVNGTNASNSLYSNVSNGSSNFEWINTTNLINASQNLSFWFYATCNTPGIYNLSVITFNGTYGVLANETNITVNVNDTTPSNVSVTYPSNNSNYSLSSINFNITVLDNYKIAPRGICWYSLNSGTNNNTMTNTTTAPTMWNATNTSLADGNYVAKFWCNDSANNANNSELVNFTIDTTDPTVAFTCSPTVISHGGTITCSCSVSDTLTGVETSSYTINPSTLLYGTKTTTCLATDYANNSASTTLTYHVIDGGGGPSSSGSSGDYTQTITEDDKEFSEVGEITKSLSKNNRIKIKINNQEHYIGVKEVTATSVLIEVSSATQVTSFTVGAEQKFDVNVDGYYDLNVKLNSIESQKADITIKSIHEKILTKTKEGNAELNGTTQKSTNRTLIIGIILIVLIIIGYFFFNKKKRK